MKVLDGCVVSNLALSWLRHKMQVIGHEDQISSPFNLSMGTLVLTVSSDLSHKKLGDIFHIISCMFVYAVIKLSLLWN